MSTPQLIEGTKFARKCDITGEGMNEGYCINNGEKYIKGDFDMLQHITDETEYKTIEEAYEDNYYYHTEWEQESDFEYIVKNGVLVDIEEEQEQNLETKISAAKQVLKDAGYLVDSMWQLDDIIGTADNYEIDITKEQARVVADSIERSHDACYGINWETIKAHIDLCFPELIKEQED